MSSEDSAIVLRPASLDDARFLFDCRNDPDTRVNSFNTEEVIWSDHLAWLRTALTDPGRRLFVAEQAGVAVGVGRGDKTDSGWVLSWAVARNARGRGVGTRLVRALADNLEGPLEAWVRADNEPSRKIAESCGMVETGQSKGAFAAFRLDRSWP